MSRPRSGITPPNPSGSGSRPPSLHSSRASHDPHRPLRRSQERGTRPRSRTLPRASGTAHFRAGLARGLVPLGQTPGHADQREPALAGRAQGPQVSRGGDGEVLFRGGFRAPPRFQNTRRPKASRVLGSPLTRALSPTAPPRSYTPPPNPRPTT